MEILIPLAFFAMIAAIVILPRYFRSQERQKLQETLRAAVERGEPIPPEIVAAMTGAERSRPEPMGSPERDLRRGVVWLAVGLGIGLMGYFAGYSEPDTTSWMLGVAAIPCFIGAAFLLLWFLGRKKA